jgi:uncharacterized protein
MPFSSSRRLISRRNFLLAGLTGAGGLALYSSEIARHWIDVTELDIHLTSLPAAFEGLRVAQLSDIHFGEFTEHFFLRRVVEKVNRLRPDVVLLTGDFITQGLPGAEYATNAAWECAAVLNGLACRERYAILGNHDVLVNPTGVMEALGQNGVRVLRNAYLPLERDGGRLWLAGLDDALEGSPDPETAIPEMIRNQPNEPVILMCHAPDYVRRLLAHPVGQAVGLMLSGHTHGGQVRLPFVRPLALPPLGRRYVEGRYQLGSLQLYVNRGIGTVNLPIRLNCPPEITVFTLRRG